MYNDCSQPTVDNIISNSPYKNNQLKFSNTFEIKRDSNLNPVKKLQILSKLMQNVEFAKSGTISNTKKHSVLSPSTTNVEENSQCQTVNEKTKIKVLKYDLNKPVKKSDNETTLEKKKRRKSCLNFFGCLG